MAATKLTKIDGAYDVLDADGIKLGTVEKFSWGQWRFKLTSSGTPLDGTFVAVANTRADAVEDGADFAERAAFTFVVSDTRLWADLLKLSEQYGSRNTTADFRSGEAYRLLGAMDYIKDRLVELGGDSQVIGRIIHQHSHREDYQVAV